MVCDFFVFGGFWMMKLCCVCVSCMVVFWVVFEDIMFYCLEGVSGVGGLVLSLCGWIEKM